MRNILLLLAILVLDFVMSLNTMATLITVGESGCDYTSIQAAIDAALNDDVISIEDAVLTEAGIVVNKNLTIQGKGADNTIVQAHESFGSANDRVFKIESGKNVTMRYMSIQHGYTLVNGGGILNIGSLMLINCNVSDNKCRIFGGGISNSSGTLVLINCTVSRNYVSLGDGGGIANSVWSTSTFTNCTINENHADYNGGGIYNYNNTTSTLTNCTISGNQADSNGGGIGNSTHDNTIYIKNTLLANNTASENPDDFHSGDLVTLYDNGYNIVEHSKGTGYTFNATGDITGEQDNLNLSSTLELNNTLNGTKTLRITSGSVAIDAGDPNDTPNNGVVIPTTDQRGFTRNGRTDIGAYEFGGEPIPEPTTIVLMGCGLLGLLGIVIRHHRKDTRSR